ncbi:mycofactocin-coupled SDR family oxidoreductase [Natrialbaceae archaeon A-gly3]
MPTYDLEETIAFVTGAARGQGRSHTVRFAQAGADVVAVDVAADPASARYPLSTAADLEETVRQVEATGGRALAVHADVREESQVEAAVEEALDTFGRIDILVANAGIWDSRNLLELEERAWDAVLGTNLKGTWLCAKHVGKHLIERGGGGKIVTVASTAGLVGARGSGHYAASKHGVVGLTKTLALELAEYGVTANCVCPTGVDTPMIEGVLEEVGPEPFERISDVSGSMNVLDGELLEPAAVSEACLWLASPAARYVTGAVVSVDAGMTAK